jgi:hypothetical protein
MKNKSIGALVIERVPANLYDKVLNVSRRAGWKMNGKAFHGCEVCWTCALFKVESQTCVWRYMDSPYENSVFIENPEWYRCNYWKEGE